jgi:hypothetical protein
MHNLTRPTGEGSPVPFRRTFAKGILPFAHSLLAALSASMPPLAIKAGSIGTGDPSPSAFDPEIACGARFSLRMRSVSHVGRVWWEKKQSYARELSVKWYLDGF